jgi:hypothetical protein
MADTMLRTETVQGADELLTPGIRFDAIEGSLGVEAKAATAHDLEEACNSTTRSDVVRLDFGGHRGHGNRL